MDPNGQPPNVPGRKALAFLLFQLSLNAILFTYVRISVKPDPEIPTSVMSDLPKLLKGGRPADKEPPKLTLLLWTWPFGVPCPIESCTQMMGIPECHITVDRSWYPKADAVIIHHSDLYGNPKLLPQEPRPPSQRWIWLNMESPTTYPVPSSLDNRFNLTMSYRRDSDIFSPYGWMEVLPQPQNVTIPPKSKLVAWVVSKWRPELQRVKYYEELKKYLQVDIYGRQHRPLPQDQFLPTLSQYKFYLAFENSIHEDYITEKVWRNSFLSWAVPVVLGPPRKNYERHMPPDSFIHIDDFSSPQELAKFLHELDRNATRYESYFHWRTWLKSFSELPFPPRFCRACRYLQNTPVQYQTVPELNKWYQ